MSPEMQHVNDWALEVLVGVSFNFRQRQAGPNFSIYTKLYACLERSSSMLSAAFPDLNLMSIQ